MTVTAKLNKVQTKDTRFTCVFNQVIQDKSLSWKARGIFIYLWSMPDDWSFSEMEIKTHSIDGRSALRSGLHELEAHHYLIRESPRNNNHLKAGQNKWIISDKQMSENRTSNNKMSDKQMSENRTLQNKHSTKYLSRQNNNLINTYDGKPNYRSMIIKDLQALMVNINSFVADDIDNWLNDYDPKLILKAIHQVGSTSPSPTWVVKDVSTQLHRGCRIHQPRQRNNYGHAPIKEHIPDWAKDGYKPKLHRTSPKLQAKIRKQLSDLGYGKNDKHGKH